MGRYYCKDCGTIVIEGDNTRRSDDCIVYCPYCEDDKNNDVVMWTIPDYETFQQYEMRTGKKWNGLVWTKCGCKDTHSEMCEKCPYTVWNGRPPDRIFGRLSCGSFLYICAQSPEPPPDDWKPEEGA